jgi:glucoamylase
VASFANAGGMIPEQVWDAADIPARELYFGRPTGSAMPLAWAHAEYIKLVRSLRDGAVFDMPPQPFERYCRRRTVASRRSWRFNHKVRTMPAGSTLRMELLAAAVVHWSADGWVTPLETPTRDTGLGVHVADLETAAMNADADVVFTFRWSDAGRWEDQDFSVHIVDR